MSFCIDCGSQSITARCERCTDKVLNEVKHLKRSLDIESYTHAIYHLTTDYWLRNVEGPRQIAQHPNSPEVQLVHECVRTINDLMNNKDYSDLVLQTLSRLIGPNDADLE